MVRAKEHGIKKVEKEKKDKNRWREKERQMHGWSRKKAEMGRKRWVVEQEFRIGVCGPFLWLCCFHVCVSAPVDHSQPENVWILLCPGIGKVHDQ